MTRTLQPNVTIPLSRPPTVLRRRRALAGSTALGGFARLVLWGLAGSLLGATAAGAQGLPTGGTVSAGAASVATEAGTLTVTQTSQNAAINWQSFGIGKDNAVVFVQPNASSVALNRVLGADPSVILGSLSANGKVFLVNPNGIMFGKGAQVNVGGLVASTLGITDGDFMAGRYAFSGSGGTVLNAGTITADGGYVALLGANVGNDGVIQARFGTVALAAGEAVTLDVAGDGLLNVTVDTGAVNALVRNGGMIRADGGQVVMTAQAAGLLLKTVVNNTGVIEARTLENRGGRIMLLGDMQGGTTNVAGTLDASAPDGGDGGFVETSAATVNVAGDARVTTAAPGGTTGTWLIDPQDFTIGGGGNISGSTLSALLVTNSVMISTLPGPSATVPGTPPVTTIGTTVPGNGDINVDEAVAWTAAPSTTTLTLTAVRDVNVNAPITATNGNIVLCCGRDANINAALTTTNGSILLSAGRDVSLNAAGHNLVNLASVGTITTTDGNLTLCAGLDVIISGAVTVTRGTTVPAQSLGLSPGLTLISGNSGTGPGLTGGTVTFSPGTPPVTVTKAAVVIDYNPASYGAPIDHSVNFVLTEGASLTERMLLYPTVSKVADGTTAAVLTGFKTTAVSGSPSGVALVGGPAATATFDSAAPGADIGITYSGYSIAGADAAKYALAVPCCNAPTRTTGTITPAPAVTPPVVTPPVVTPPVVVPPVVTPPVVVPPVVVPPVVTPPVVVPPVVTPPVVVPPVEVPPVVVPPVVTPPIVVPPVVVPPVEVPPVVVPPVVVPPVVVPPVEVPPVIVPPVIVPPVVAPPVVVPPVVVPPVVTPPVVVPPVEVPPVVVPPVIVPPVQVPPVVVPPVVTPPVIVPPVEVPPVVVPPVVTPPVVVPPVEVPPVVVPPVVTPPVIVPPVEVPPVVVPPVVTPPVIVPPVEVPPVVVPPVVTPPVVTPPVIVPPVEVPPVVVPPVVTPPVVPPLVVPPVIVPPVVTPPVVPPVAVIPVIVPLVAPAIAPVLVLTGAGIASANALVSGGAEQGTLVGLAQTANLSVVGKGVLMPGDQLGEVRLAQLDRPAVAPVFVAPIVQPRMPIYPRKQDRN